MIEAIAAASGIPVADVRRAAMYAGSLAGVARVAMTEGTAGLARFQLELFSPVAPMLAQTAAAWRSAEELGGGGIALEWKLDGARVQAHKEGGRVRLYTRTLNEVTDALPVRVGAVRALRRRPGVGRGSHRVRQSRDGRTRSRSRCGVSAAGSKSRSC